MKQTMIGMAPGPQPPAGGGRPQAGAVPAPSGMSGAGAKTVLGIAPPAGPPAGAPAGGGSVAPGTGVSGAGAKTVLGIAPPALVSGESPPDAAAPPTATSGTEPQRGEPAGTGPSAAASAQTVVGVAAPALVASGSPPQGAAPQHHGAAPTAGSPASAPVPSEKRTVLGVAMPGIAPLNPGVQKPPAAPPASAPVPSEKRTVLGVAMPGIAPLNPGVQKPPSVPAPAPQPVRHPPSVEPTTEELQVLPGHRRGPPLVAILSIVIAVLLAIGGIVVAILWAGGPSISAEVTVGDDGAEQLRLTCDDCKDGETLRVGEARAAVTAKTALVSLETPLHVGDNEMTVIVERANGSRDEAELVVPVEYRIRGDLDALSGDPPKLRVTVEAAEGVAVVVDGNPVDLDDSGRGVVEIDATESLTGMSAKPVPLEREIPYSVKTGDGAPTEGRVTLGVGITPLVVSAPGERIVVDSARFMLAGRTDPRGTVTVEGRPITVDSRGQFAQMMNVSSVGATTITVRATAPDQAPRLVPIEVKRVESLTEEAKHFAAEATTAYSGVATHVDDKAGWKVALKGKVTEVRHADRATIILLEVTRGCEDAPCLARLVHGRNVDLDEGDVITAFGRVRRAVEGLRAGRKVPEIAVDFLLEP